MLTFYVDGGVIQVYLNQMYFLGEMILQPAGDDPEPMTVVVDIKPGSEGNPFNMKAQGVLPVAILGTAALDVQQIALSSLKLADVAPLRNPRIADVQGDGIPDLVLHFDNPAVASVLAGSADGETVGLELTGVLLDGTPILGEDSIKVILKSAKGK